MIKTITVGFRIPKAVQNNFSTSFLFCNIYALFYNLSEVIIQKEYH